VSLAGTNKDWSCAPATCTNRLIDRLRSLNPTVSDMKIVWLGAFPNCGSGYSGASANSRESNNGIRPAVAAAGGLFLNPFLASLYGEMPAVRCSDGLHPSDGDGLRLTNAIKPLIKAHLGPDTAPPGYVTSLENAVIARVNAFRTDKGLSALRCSGRGSGAVRSWSNTQARQGFPSQAGFAGNVRAAMFSGTVRQAVHAGPSTATGLVNSWAANAANAAAMSVSGSECIAVGYKYEPGSRVSRERLLFCTSAPRQAHFCFSSCLL
jgi:hypothetical protein